MNEEQSLDLVVASKQQHAILRILNDAESKLHAPEICERDRRLKKTTIYVLLGRMQKRRLVESWVEEKQPGRSGPARRFFSLTQTGKRVLAATDAARKATLRTHRWEQKPDPQPP